MANNPVKVNPLGQMADDVVEQLKDAGSSAAKAVVSEPAKILEQILGGSPTADVEQGVANSSANSGQLQQQQDEMLKLKQQKAQEKAAAAYKLHQQRLQEEIAYHQQRKQQEAQQQAAEQQHEDQKKEVVQLQKEKEEEAVWQQQLKAVQGSHEGQQGKM